MAVAVDEGGLATRVAAPKHEYKVFAVAVECLDSSVRKLAPTQSLVTVGLVGTYGKRGIEQQHSLSRPACEVTIARHGLAEVHFYFFEDVDERWES